jgi:hypothetical protein
MSHKNSRRKDMGHSLHNNRSLHLRDSRKRDCVFSVAIWPGLDELKISHDTALDKLALPLQDPISVVTLTSLMLVDVEFDP